MKYDAFISYRHLPLDMFVAKTIHTTLESFVLPKNLRKVCKKQKIERIFRDQDELPLSSNLSEPIEQALGVSDYLIVICTPKLKESEWCKKEIETFKKLHGQSRILAVLAEGEPRESFPPEILTEEYESVDEYGNTVINIRNVEPLAADVRGRNKRTIKKRIKEESLRLLAPIFGLSYDDLKQRHRERHIKRIVMISSIISAFLLVFGIVSTTMAITIHRQSKIVKEGYSQLLAEEAVSTYKTGDVEGARLLLEEAKEMQYNSSVEAAGIKMEGDFSPEGMLIPAYSSILDTGLNSMALSPDEKYLVICDVLGKLHIMETESGNMKRPDLDVGTASTTNGELVFLDDHRFLYAESGIPTVYDIEKDESIPVSAMYDPMFFEEKNGTIYQVSGGVLYGFDSKDFSCTQQMVLSDETDGEMDSATAIATSKSGKQMIIFASVNKNYQTPFCIIDIETWESVTPVQRLDGIVVDVTASDSGFYANLTKIPEDNSRTSSQIVAIDGNGEIVWESEATDVVNSGIDYVENGRQKVLYTYNPDGPISLNAANGEILHAPGIEGMIIHSNKGATDGFYYLCTRECDLLSYDALSGTVESLNHFAQIPSLAISDAVLTDRDCFISFRGSDYITAYKALHHDNGVMLSADATDSGEGFFFANVTPAYELLTWGSEVTFPDGDYMDVLYTSRDGKYLAGFDYLEPKVKIYHEDETGSAELVGTIDSESSFLSTVFFSEDTRYVCLSYQSGKLAIYDMDSLSLVKEIKDEYLYVRCMLPMANGRYLMDTMYKTCILDENFDVLWDMTKSEDYALVGYDEDTDKLICQSKGCLYAWTCGK